MKEKISSKKSAVKASAQNFILNSIIAVLCLIIAFMILSLVTKFQRIKESESAGAKKKRAADIVQLEVLNGCGVMGVAEKFTEYLRKKNFDVVQVGNYRSFDIDSTMVIDRTGNTANAEKVAGYLGINNSNIIQHINNDYFLDVTLVIGKDYGQLISRLPN
ncbi:MAG TPA: LytR C-terminal domain-containing protein [Ignavibacteriaceae bacterium]|nr:LytR C-terminal domain-containing protein [Ignavibacteriaceae bacterium]